MSRLVILKRKLTSSRLATWLTTFRPFVHSILACLVIVSLSQASAAGQDKAGAKLYSLHCAKCHGSRGEGGTDSFVDPLQGDLSVAELARYIDETMPEQDPELVQGEDAKTVAKFIFDKFYSEQAQIKSNRPRVELARLTVDQYRNRVADVVASFSNPVLWDEKRGLPAEYFASRYRSQKMRLSQQTDATINFPDAVPHFDPTGKYESIPKPKKKPVNKMGEGFSVYWKGSVLAPETGWYEFKVKSKNGFELYVNDPEKPLIDRAVRSDEALDHSAKIYLLAGRHYSLRLDFFSYPSPPAKIQLLWKPPHHPEQVIPQSQLFPNSVPEVLCVSSQFPADDASTGYARGVDVSREWDDATTRGAVEAAIWISERIEKLAGFRFGDKEARAKTQKFCERFVSRAFVTKLSDDDLQIYVGQHFEQPISIPNQVKRVVLMTLKSPRFLYPTLEKREPNYHLASLASIVIWDSVPNKPFFDLLSKDKARLSNPVERRKILDLMVKLPAARQKLNSFFETWLVAHSEESTKDTKRFPEFDPELVADLKTSLLRFAEQVAWSNKSDYRELFLADYLLANARIAKYYRLQSDDDESGGFRSMATDPKVRSGLITHPYLMSALAYHQESSPIHRGVFVAKKLLGRRLRQPPNNVKPLTEEFAPEMTTRERVEHQTKEPTCMSCHSVINPLGFSLEHFDADGRYRKQDGDRPIDSETVYRSPEGAEVNFKGPKDLANYLANDPSAQKNFIRQLFRFYTKNDITAYDPDLLDQMHQQFVKNEFNIRELVIDIAQVVMDHSEK